jgi:hypothetical protein
VLAGALELFLVSLGLTYYGATVGAGLRVIRRARKARREQAAAAAAAAAAPPAGTASRGAWSGARSGSGAWSGSGARSGSRRRPAPRRAARTASAADAAGGLVSAGAQGAGTRGSGPAADLAASVAVGWGRLRTRLETAEEPAARAGPTSDGSPGSRCRCSLRPRPWAAGGQPYGPPLRRTRPGRSPRRWTARRWA